MCLKYLLPNSSDITLYKLTSNILLTFKACYQLAVRLSQSVIIDLDHELEVGSKGLEQAADVVRASAAPSLHHSVRCMSGVNHYPLLAHSRLS